MTRKITIGALNLIHNEIPVFQPLLIIKKIKKQEDSEIEKRVGFPCPSRFRLVLSDGKYNMRGELVNSLHWMIENGDDKMEKLSEGIFRKRDGVSVNYIYIEEIKLLSQKIKLNKSISPFSVRAMESVVPPGIIGRVRTLAEVFEEKTTPVNTKVVILVVVKKVFGTRVAGPLGITRDLEVQDTSKDESIKISVFQDVSSLEFYIGDVLLYENVTVRRIRNEGLLNAFREEGTLSPRVIINPNCKEGKILRRW
ncbi:hypothetical protein NEOLI_000618 [Neolecta irregularis DAH-3]|uniref:Uncharacterized protein n=1 Tax=Neolecta irregularis (strain DAH-3) TaxID=1198029 RepID=A0A1U7LU93_NEOID|nr:hypothetical protein NEOLI_000618 [Neolecta irregularis DAH-3]|eukprot:OLL26112.1 hypothetical protein NEOLI_000618 [Neolecta irregularis DAH-3]